MIERSANQVAEYFHQLKNPSSAASLSKTATATSANTTTTSSNQSQTTPINDSNPISPLSVASQTSASDSSTTSSNAQVEQHRYIFDFSKLMLHSYNSTYYWNKAERLSREKSLKGLYIISSLLTNGNLGICFENGFSCFIFIIITVKIRIH